MQVKQLHEMSAIELRSFVNQLKEDQRKAENRLEMLVRQCKHDWGSAQYDPIISGGYSYEASGGGVDYRPGGYVPRTEGKRWKRTCNLCGKQEYTQKEVPVAMKPQFE